MLGLSKVFVIVLALAALVGWGTHSFMNFFVIVAIYAIGKIIYNALT